MSIWIILVLVIPNLQLASVITILGGQTKS